MRCILDVEALKKWLVEQSTTASNLHKDFGEKQLIVQGEFQAFNAVFKYIEANEKAPPVQPVKRK